MHEPSASGRAAIRDGLTFDDVLLVPGPSSVHPTDVDLSAQLTPGIRMKMPLVASPMDTVTEHRTAICMAQEGGIGFVHKNLSIEAQAAEVAKVKRYESGMIVDPITLGPDQPIQDALDIMREHHISGLPVVRGEKLVGIVTNRDLRFVRKLDVPVSTVMTSEGLITVRVGVSMETAKELLHENRIEKLLVVDDRGNLRGLITIKDIEKQTLYPNANKDALGRLRVGAAVGVTKDALERADALIRAGADLLLVDSSHGHAEAVLSAVSELHATFPEVEIVGGNVATAEGAEALIKAHVSAVRCGVGPASICTTRIIAGVGVPQLTAIMDAAEICRRARRAADRRRRGEVLGRHREGAGRWRGHGHDRLAVRGHRREPGRPRAAPGPLVQGVPRDGIALGDARGLPRSLLPAGGACAVEARARGRRGTRAAPRPALEQRLPAARRGALGHGTDRRAGPRVAS